MNKSNIKINKSDLKKDKNNIRFVKIDGEKYYVAIDIAKVVGKKSDFVARRVDTIKFSGYRGGMIFVSEQNLHAFIAKVEQKFPEYKKIVFEASAANEVSAASERRVQAVQAVSEAVTVVEEQTVKEEKLTETIVLDTSADNDKKEETVEEDGSFGTTLDFDIMEVPLVQTTSEMKDSMHFTDEESGFVFIEPYESILEQDKTEQQLEQQTKETEQLRSHNSYVISRCGFPMDFEPDQKIIDAVEATCGEWLDENFPETMDLYAKIEEEIERLEKNRPQKDGTKKTAIESYRTDLTLLHADEVQVLLLEKSSLRSSVASKIIGDAKEYLAAAIAGYANDYDTFVRDMRLFKQGKLQSKQLSMISKMEIPGVTEVQRWMLRQIFNVDPRENYPKDFVKTQEWVEYMISDKNRERMMAFERVKQWDQNNPNAETIPDEFYEFFPKAYRPYTSAKKFREDVYDRYISYITLEVKEK